MSNTKSKLLSKNRRIAKKLTIEIDGENVEVALCKPTMGDRAKVLEAAQTAGEINDKGEPVSNVKGLRMTARIVAAVLSDPETKQRFFSDKKEDLAELLEAPWLDEVLPECQKVFTPDVEDAKGKSEATPTSN